MSTPFRSKKGNNGPNTGTELPPMPSGALASSSFRHPTAANAAINESRGSVVINARRRAAGKAAAEEVRRRADAKEAVAEEARRVAAAEEAAAAAVAEETARLAEVARREASAKMYSDLRAAEDAARRATKRAEETARHAAAAEEAAHRREYADVVDMAIAIYNDTNSDIKTSVILHNVHALINRASKTVGMKKFDWTKYATVCLKQSILFRDTESQHNIVRELLRSEDYDSNNNKRAIKEYDVEVEMLRININNARISAAIKRLNQQRINLITERLLKLRDANMILEQTRVNDRLPTLRKLDIELRNEAAAAKDFLRHIMGFIMDNAPPIMEEYAKRSLSSIVNVNEGGGRKRTRRGKRGGRGSRKGIRR